MHNRHNKKEHLSRRGRGVEWRGSCTIFFHVPLYNRSMTFRSNGCVYFFQYHPCLVGQFQTMLYIHKISLYDFLDLIFCVILRSKNIPIGFGI